MEWHPNFGSIVDFGIVWIFYVSTMTVMRINCALDPKLHLIRYIIHDKQWKWYLFLGAIYWSLRLLLHSSKAQEKQPSDWMEGLSPPQSAEIKILAWPSDMIQSSYLENEALEEYTIVFSEPTVETSATPNDNTHFLRKRKK